MLMAMKRGESCSSTKSTKLKCSLEVKIEDNRKNFEALSYFEDAWPLYPIIKLVPNMLREEKQEAYTPSVVSIGPLHSRNEFLKAMEADKLSYMCSLFERTKNFEKTRNDCVEAMLKMENTFEKCYPDQAKLVEDVTSLIEMILIDGCFIIELVYRKYRDEKKDPILQDHFKFSAVRRDLLLLENQIPFDALKELFKLTVGSIPIPAGVTPTPTTTPTLIGCLVSFFGDMLGLEDSGDFKKKDGTPAPYHILHLLHICYQPPLSAEDGASSRQEQPGGCTATQPVDNNINVEEGGEGRAFRGQEQPGGHQGTAATQQSVLLRATFSGFDYSLICSQSPSEQPDNTGGGQEQAAGYEGTATQLHNGGVKLRKRPKTKNLFDVKYDQDCSFYFSIGGHLQIPRFSVHNFTESFLRNLIAFEQCCPLIGSFFTSHAFLMDILIDSVEDVKLLEKAGVISNHLGSSESVLQIFNGISKNAVPRKFHYQEEWRNMKGCCTPWQEQLGTVKRNCAGNLWLVLSVIGAFVLFVLTFLQTLYTLISYYHPSS